MALLVLLTLALPLVAPSHDASPSTAQEQAVPQQLAPRSGEERLLPDGTFVRVADPRPGNGPIEEGWQQALWTEMAEAIQKGEEQVVMVFSRENCPWCDRLHPVLQNAIKRRAAAISDGSRQESAPLLNSPLRIFVYDAMEFGPIMQRFKITGFPTILAFGPPGSRPAMVPGYLGDDDFDRLLAEIAVAEPATEERPQKQKRRGVFR
jgi:thioredoxin-related protein